MSHAWALISIPDGRQYGGNAGYEEDPRRVYRYDSFVPNHKRLQAGDLAFIRNRQAVLGVACIEAVTERTGKKARNRCPICNTSRIKQRKRVHPAWRCADGHEFDWPVTASVDAILYEARYEDSYRPLQGQISVADLRKAALRPNDQLSIQELELGLLEGRLKGPSLDLDELLGLHLQLRRPAAVDADGAPIGDAPHELTSPFAPTFTDARERVIRLIAQRRGQKKFRDQLIRRYGPACMVSGCTLLDVVDAAHIWPYRGTDDNHPDNGLLLRTDLHTLFDLDLMSINPDDLTAHFHPAALETGYSDLRGCSLQLSRDRRPSQLALQARWRSFQQRMRD